jgi:hypothetical protein
MNPWQSELLAFQRMKHELARRVNFPDGKIH